MEQSLNKMEIFIRTLCEPYDKENKGLIHVDHLMEAIKKTDKFILSKIQVIHFFISYLELVQLKSVREVHFYFNAILKVQNSLIGCPEGSITQVISLKCSVNCVLYLLKFTIRPSSFKASWRKMRKEWLTTSSNPVSSLKSSKNSLHLLS